MTIANALCDNHRMSKTKLSVETPYGTVTRTTERDYKFVVVVFGQDEAYLRRKHAEGVAYATAKAAEYRATAAKGGVLYSWAKPGDTVYTCGQSPEDFTGWAEDNERKAAEPFVMPEAKLGAWGWSGSMKGAAKMASDAAAVGYVGIKIVPVPGK